MKYRNVRSRFVWIFSVFVWILFYWHNFGITLPMLFVADRNYVPHSNSQDIQTWILSVLQPTTPVPLPNNFYRVGSQSSRLQQLPAVKEYYHSSKNGYRFPSNPAVTRHVSNYSASRQIFHLEIQIDSVRIERPRGQKTKYFPGNHKWYVAHVLLEMVLNVSNYDRTKKIYQSINLTFSNIHRLQTTRAKGFKDMRLLPSRGKLTFFSSHPVFIGDIPLSSSRPSISNFNVLKFDDIYQTEFPKQQKNWMCIPMNEDENRIYCVVHFAPFTVVSCEMNGTCILYAFNSLMDSALPSSRIRWRGSSQLVPLPAHPHLLLGTIHYRYSVIHDNSSNFTDRYEHRFVLIDRYLWRPLGYTEPFSFFAPNEQVDWIEFIIGMAFSESEILLTFGFNDQEAWIAVLPINGLFQFFKPVFPLEEQSRQLRSLDDFYRQY